jgi:hypothetical protein
MKRVLTFLAIMLLPLSVMAMTPVADSDLADVTGQAGVNINANLTMDINIGTMAWGDADGIDGVYNVWPTVGAGGYIGISNFQITNLQIRARAAASDSFNLYKTLFLKPITIDVATGTKNEVDNVTFVRFGLGALHISMSALQFDVGLSAGETAVSGTLGTLGVTELVLDQNMGRVSLGDMNIYINPWSYVDIYAHDGSGVNFDMAITIDRFAMDYMSWGDTDGLPEGNGIWMNTADNAAGYVGIDNFVMGNAFTPAITINGSVAIDVVTSAGGTYSYLNSLLTALSPAAPYIDIRDQAQMYDLYTAAEALGRDMNDGQVVADYIEDALWFQYGQIIDLTYTDIPLTTVHIAFPADFDFSVAKMTGDVVLSDSYTVDAAVDTTNCLGDFYIEGFDLKIREDSWVDIWAH